MIKPVNMQDIPGRGFKEGKIQADLLQFASSEWPAAEVEAGDYASTASAACAYRKTAERLRVAVTVVTRKGRLFLVKEVAE